MEPDHYGAEITKFVDVGSEEYYARVPYRFRKQRLTQVAVLGVSYSLLVIGSPKGAYSTTLIKYLQSLIGEFLQLLRHEHISAPYRWFAENADKDISDEELCKLIPVQAEQCVRELIQSKLPMVRAVHCYRIKTKQPLEATSCSGLELLTHMTLARHLLIPSARW